MYQKTVRIHKCVQIVSTCRTIMCQNSVILLLSDTFPTHFHHQKQRSLGNIVSRKLSEFCHKSTSDTFLTHNKGNISQNVSLELCHKSIRHWLLTDFWYISNSGLWVLLTTNVSEICQNLYFWQISDTFLILV